jgi:hypothetical protein
LINGPLPVAYSMPDDALKITLRGAVCAASQRALALPS